MLDKEQLVKYYKKAAALLMPIQWQEPFGLSMVEANACGTPVIAFNRGSVPEVIVDGKTGFIVDNSAEMILSIAKLNKIKRKECREHVVKNFSRTIMIENYERVLQDIVTNHTPDKSPHRAGRPKHIKRKLTKLSRKISEGILGTKD